MHGLPRFVKSFFFLFLLIGSVAAQPYNNLFGTPETITSNGQTWIVNNTGVETSSNSNITLTAINTINPVQILSCGGTNCIDTYTEMTSSAWQAQKFGVPLNAVEITSVVFRIQNANTTQKANVTIKLKDEDCNQTVFSQASLVLNANEFTWTARTLGLSSRLSLSAVYCLQLSSNLTGGVRWKRSTGDVMTGSDAYTSTSENGVYTVNAYDFDFDLNGRYKTVSPLISSANDSGTIDFALDRWTGASSSRTSTASVYSGVISCNAFLVSTATARVCGFVPTSGGSHQIRFYWDGTNLYADNFKSGSQTRTDLGTYADGNHSFTVKYVYGSVVDFYLDGSLVASHTTNVPIVAESPHFLQESGSGFLAFSQVLENVLPSNAEINLLGNGSGKYNVQFQGGVANEPNYNVWYMNNSNWSWYFGDTANKFFNPVTTDSEAVQLFDFNAPKNNVFSHCNMTARSTTWGSNDWIQVSVSSNGTQFVEVFNITGNGVSNNTHIVLDNYLVSSQKLQIKGTEYVDTVLTNAQFLRSYSTEYPFVLNCSLTNTSNTDLPNFVSGSNQLQADFSANSSDQAIITSSFFARTNGSLYLRGFDEITQNALNVTWTISNTSNTTVLTNTTLYFNYTDIPNGDLTITVNASGYQNRIYSTTFNELTAQTLDAYLIPDDSNDLLVRFHVSNSQQAGVIGARVNISRNFAGTWTTVGQQNTDDSGIATFFMNINQQYQTSVSATGYFDYSATITPSTQDYYITLTSTTVSNFSTIFYNFTYNLTPTYFNATQIQPMQLFVNDLNSELTYANLTLWLANGSILFNDSITTSTGGTINVNVNTSNKSPYVLAQIQILRATTSLYEVNRTYAIGNYGNGTNSWTNITNTINDSDASNFAKGFIVILASIAVTAWINRHAPSGYSGLVAVAVLAFFTGLIAGLNVGLFLGGILAVLWFIYKRLARG